MGECFIVTPIGDEGSKTRERSDKVLKHIIDPVVTGLLKMEPIRSDRISNPGNITTEIIKHLVEAEVVVADLTDGNPNVFYEIAVRHATRKPMVTIIEVGSKIPADIADSRTIFYDLKDLDNVDECKRKLKSHIEFVVAHPEQVTNTISITIDLMGTKSKDPLQQGYLEITSKLQELDSKLTALINMGNTRGPDNRLAEVSMDLCKVEKKLVEVYEKQEYDRLTEIMDDLIDIDIRYSNEYERDCRQLLAMGNNVDQKFERNKYGRFVSKNVTKKDSKK
jgi:hypothetical protein